jgi:hypothetical protein
MDLTVLISSLPEVLSTSERNALANHLRLLVSGESAGIDYSKFFALEKNSKIPGDELSQGDVVELPFANIEAVMEKNEKFEPKPSMIMSNSCAISPGNEKAQPSRIVYAPALRLSKLENRFGSSRPGFAASIRKQQPMNMFYVPARHGINEELVTVFDGMLNISPNFKGSKKLLSSIKVRLGLHGYYILLIKLTLFLTRSNDNAIMERI